jgi:hypothetical protein
VIISAVGQDDYGCGVSSGTINLEDVDSGHIYGIEQNLLGFPLSKPGWPKAFGMTVLVMEDEGADGIGSLSDKQKQIVDKIEALVKEKLEELAVAYVPVLAPILVPIIDWCIGELFDWICSWFNDQWFPPATSVVHLPSVHFQWDGSTSKEEWLRFLLDGGEEGHYLIKCSWVLIP